jgi:hypothetical protein
MLHGRDPKYIGSYLRYYIVSHLKLKEKWPDVVDFVDRADASQREYLEHHFAPGSITSDYVIAEYGF